jgi:hypothetical protein
MRCIRGSIGELEAQPAVVGHTNKDGALPNERVNAGFREEPLQSRPRSKGIGRAEPWRMEKQAEDATAVDNRAYRVAVHQKDRYALRDRLCPELDGVTHQARVLSEPGASRRDRECADAIARERNRIRAPALGIRTVARNREYHGGGECGDRVAAATPVT